MIDRGEAPREATTLALDQCEYFPVDQWWTGAMNRLESLQAELESLSQLVFQSVDALLLDNRAAISE